MRQRYPKAGVVDADLIRQVETAKDVITKIREVRSQNQIKPKEELEVRVQDSEAIRGLFALEGLKEMLEKMAFLSSLETTGGEVANSKTFISGTDKYYVVLNQEIDVAAEIKKAQEELSYQQGFLRSVEAKLSNERFVSGAPAAVVDAERKKLADAQARIRILEDTLSQLKA
jgi:valyl-tRNA synthetase